LHLLKYNLFLFSKICWPFFFEIVDSVVVLRFLKETIRGVGGAALISEAALI
jgi:hypothetical protein